MKRTVIKALVLGFLALLPSMTGADEEFVYSDHGLRDPFWPLVSSGGAVVNYDSSLSSSEIVLEGIIADGKSRLAIINGVIVEEGKRVGLYTVQQVLPDRVVLIKDGQTTVLQLKKEE